MILEPLIRQRTFVGGAIYGFPAGRAKSPCGGKCDFAVVAGTPPLAGRGGGGRWFHYRSMFFFLPALETPGAVKLV